MSEVTTVPSFPHIPLCRDLDEIVPGKILLFHHRGGNERYSAFDDDFRVIGYTKPYEEVAVVVSDPYRDGVLDSYRFDVEVMRLHPWFDDDSLTLKSYRYASDAGIVPYGNGMWNKWNTTKIVGYGMELYV